MWNFIIAADNGILKPTTKLLKGSDCVDFGEKIKTLREEKAMTQQKLADQLYVTRATVSRWESGSRYPDILTTKSLADIFGTSIDELVSGESRAIDERQALFLKNRRDKIICMLYPPMIICCLISLFVYLFLNGIGIELYCVIFEPGMMEYSLDEKLWLIVYVANSVFFVVMTILGMIGLVKVLRKEANAHNVALIGIVNFVYAGCFPLFKLIAPFEVQTGASVVEGIVLYTLTGLLVLACIFGTFATIRIFMGAKKINPCVYMILGVFIVLTSPVCSLLFLRTHSIVMEDTLMYLGCVVSAFVLLITSAYQFNIRKPIPKEEFATEVCIPSL